MDINTGQMDTGQMDTTQTTQTNQTQLTAAQLVKIINDLALAGAILSVLATEDRIIIASAYIKLIAAFLSIGAALLESNEQQIAPGVTTPLNRLKTIGSTIVVIGALVLTYVLQQETALRQAGIRPPSPAVTPVIPPATVS